MKSSSLFFIFCLARHFQHLAAFHPRPKYRINPERHCIKYGASLTRGEKSKDSLREQHHRQRQNYTRCLTIRGGVDSLTAFKNETNPILNLLMHPYVWYVGAVILVTLNFLGHHDTSKSFFCYLTFLLVASETANIFSEAANEKEKNRKSIAPVSSFTQIRGGGAMSIGMTLFTTAIQNPLLMSLLIGVTILNIYEDQIPLGSYIKNTFMYCLVGYFFYLLVQWQKLQQFEENRGD